MYSYIIAEMIQALVKNNIIQEQDADTAETIIKNEWKSKIAIVWNATDIQSRAKTLNINVTDDDAEEILSVLMWNHDASIGITWDYIDSVIQEYTSHQ
jgi:hypothetical protein